MEVNILIIDDIAKNIQVLGNLLKKTGYALSYATNGRQALNMLEEESYDLILLDIMMPKMDGFEVCKRIKKIPEKRNIPIIFLTAKNQKQDIVNGMKAGAVDYVTKPFYSEELLARVNTHIHLKLARNQVEQKNHELKKQNELLIKTNSDLKKALDRIKKLEGIIPICSHCKKIRDDKGYWNQVDAYIERHSNAALSHSICPGCAKKYYPDMNLYDY